MRLVSLHFQKQCQRTPKGSAKRTFPLGGLHIVLHIPSLKGPKPEEIVGRGGAPKMMSCTPREGHGDLHPSLAFSSSDCAELGTLAQQRGICIAY